ncbi:hypothetical protein PHYSODRAFT_481493 [Phytophthora sojae]|uniref:Uncharacterized protein n=1 Tax=Phytophthora sojae (strain P6497) TaxID=1094619 RepID=G4YYK5_PHYSP|nr:hypothetical protein PHYSODRAFT_481493 [Phytophthora sojae]EGZ25123.1 hypothetical protein PHYSODRAFT_481493 [Phytophthora sojae]|eukprot:XP_009520411.1 hypothetical protein PHYSODRAFT_481493 [Phytophthora sojae]
MATEHSDVLLLLTDAFVKQGEALHDVRREVFRLLAEEAWKVTMRSRHYLTAQCLDMPCDSAWMVLYRYETDINFLNATSLTKYVELQVCCIRCVY